MQFSGKRIADHIAHQWAFGAAAPNAASPKYISLKHALSAEVHINVYTSTNADASNVTLVQATNTGAEGAKALGFDKYLAKTDLANTDAYTLTNATSNTFATITTAARAAKYVIVVDPATLDQANNFDCLSVGLSNATNTAIHVEYHVQPRYAGDATNMPNFKVD